MGVKPKAFQNFIKSRIKAEEHKEMHAMGSVAAINAVIALVALLKDILLASYLGTSRDADAFLLAFFITDMIGCNLIANGVGTGAVPVLSRLFVADSRSGIRWGLQKINLYLLVWVGVFAAVLFLFRVPLIDLLGGGYAHDVKLETVQLFALLIPTVWVYPSVYVGIAALQVEGKFTTAAFVPVLYNSVFLAGIIGAMLLKVPTSKGIYFICFSLLAALLVMLCWTYAFLTAYGRGEPQADPAMQKKQQVTNGILSEFAKIFFPYLLMLFLTQGILYFERYLASGYAVGSVAALNYAYRVSQFPIWVFTAAIGAVAFPSMSKDHGGQNAEGSLSTLRKAIWLMLLVTVPITVLLFFLRIPVLTILFQRQAFTHESLHVTALILGTYSFAIIGQSITMLCLKYFISANRVLEPTLIFLGTATLNVLIDLLLFERIGLQAFGYGAAVAGILNAILLLSRIRLGIWRRAWDNTGNLLRLLLANAGVAAICGAFEVTWEKNIEAMGFGIQFVSMTGIGLLCIFVYAVVFHKLGRTEKTRGFKL